MTKRNPIPRREYLKSKSFRYPIISTTLLSRPSKVKKIDFFKTVLARRSANSFHILDESKLSHLLFYSAKTIEVSFSESGYMHSKRPSPSAGGIHPIDLIVYDSSRGSALHYYNPVEHSLNELELDRNETKIFIEHVHSIKSPSRNSIILWMVVHQYRTEAKYHNSASLVWRDVGCLLYCLNLVCSALKISFCSLGTLGEPYISKSFKKYGNVFGAGGCLIG